MFHLKLWSLNTEFDIEIKYPYTYNFPMLWVKSKDGVFAYNFSLRDVSLIDAMKQVQQSFPESDFIKRLLKQQPI